MSKRDTISIISANVENAFIVATKVSSSRKSVSNVLVCNKI